MCIIDLVEHARECACRIGTARETENTNPISIGVYGSILDYGITYIRGVLTVLHEESVSSGDMTLEAPSHHLVPCHYDLSYDCVIL